MASRLGRIERLEKNVAQLLREERNSAKNSQARAATADVFTWVTEYTETYNEHWQEEGRSSPYEKFPSYPYFQDLFDLLDLERITWIEKSRDLMISWACVAYLTRYAMCVPHCGVLLQTQKDDKVIQLVEYGSKLFAFTTPVIRTAIPRYIRNGKKINAATIPHRRTGTASKKFVLEEDRHHGSSVATASGVEMRSWFRLWQDKSHSADPRLYRQ